MKPDYLRRIPLKTKLGLIIVIFFCFPFLILGLIWNNLSARSIEQNTVDSNQLLVTQINSRLNAYFFDLEKDNLPLLTHPLILTFLNLDKKDVYGYYEVTNQITRQLFPTVTFSRLDIYNFSIYSTNNHLVVSSNFEENMEERIKEIRGKIDKSENFKIIGSSWSRSIPIITVARRILDSSSQVTIGMLVIDLKINEISAFFNNIKLGDSGFIWIADGNGQIIYHPEKNNFGKTVETNYSKQFISKTKGYFIDKSSGVKKLLIYERSPVTNWILVSEVPLKELTGNLLQLRNITIVIGILLIFSALVIVGGFSLSLTNSLLHLQKLMKRAEIGDLSVTAPEHHHYYNEMNSLNRGFNKMVRELGRLIEVVHIAQLKEKEMQIRQRDTLIQIMQSQINPHFLYNTLEIINSHAIIQDAKLISRMATSLADLFRYSVNNSKYIVPLQDEIEHITTYLIIQQERFDQLKVDMNFREKHLLKEVPCVKLSLQPIIENAFIHGYERQELESEYIAVHGWREDDCYKVRIIDKGGGMSQELVEQFNDHFLNITNKELIDKDINLVVRGIGLWNVHKRLRLSFGEPYGLYIISSGAQGTQIEMTLPLDKGHLESGVSNDGA